MNYRKPQRRRKRLASAVAAAAAVMLGSAFARAQQVSPPVILQYFESQWQTMEKRTPDLFMAGYGALWTPPPGRALYDDQGGGIGYNLYDRFDMGKARDRTAYGTEKSYRTLIDSVHRMNGDVYVDYVHHHVGSWDVPAYNGWGGYTPPSSAHVQDRSDYPGFELSDPYVGANSFDPNYRNLAGHRDSYPDAPPVNDGNTTQFQYQYRLANLITIDLTSNRAFVRNPVPGDANNVRQAPASWAIGTSTLLPDGKVGASTITRQANTPTTDNRRFYPDTSLPGMTVTDPKDGNQLFTIHPFNTASPSSGDPVAETPRGYMMRYAQWLINDVGVDGLRIDAARHVPFGQQPDAYNPQDLDIPSLVDRAVYRQNRRANLDGSTRNVFSFQEVFSGDKNLLNTFTRKDINPATPNVVGGNRDVLDFPMWFAMRGNFTTDGVRNNFFNVRAASQNEFGLNPADPSYVNNANNGNNAIGFVINHDDGRGNVNAQSTDFIALDNVAHAWILSRPGNAYAYFNSQEFDRTGNTTYFLKDGRGDALGGQYGTIVTKLLDIRNSYGRGDFLERYIDNAFAAPEDKKSAIYVFERDKSMIVGLNVGYNPGYAERTNVQTNFAAGTRLVELTGNHDQPGSGDPFDGVPAMVTIDGSGRIPALRIPWNNAGNGNKGYVMYGLPRPAGSVALSNVSQTLASELPGNNATARITAVDVITANTFSVTLNTTAVILPDSFRDQPADGDRAYLRIDGGLDANASGAVDFPTPGDTRYGFENFLTVNDPGFDPNPANSGNGQYVQAVNAANLSEGYHYLTARAYRQRPAGEPDIYSDFKKVIYVDRLPPSSVIDSISGSGASRTIDVRSLDLTADKVDVFTDLGAALSDAQVIALAGGGSSAAAIDRDLFGRDLTGLTTGTHALTILTREITGNYSIIRATGLATTGGAGIGFGDTNFSGAINASDVAIFQTVLESANAQFNPAAEANTDGLVNLADAFLLGPRLAAVGANAATVADYNTMIRRPFVTGGTYTVDANHTVHDVTAGTTSVLAGNTLTARSIRGSGALNVGANATVMIQPRAAGGSNGAVGALSVASNAKLDLSDTGLVVRNAVPGSWGGSAYTGLAGQIDSGRGNASSALWNGTGIVTSDTRAIGTGDLTSIGIAAASTALNLAVTATTTWFGQTVAGADTLILFTWGGDANLDGKINIDDYGQIDFNVGSSGSVFGWYNGDFNYDGKINIDDYGIIDFNVTAQTGTLGSASGAALAGVSAIPEPASAVLLLAAPALLAARKRRRA